MTKQDILEKLYEIKGQEGNITQKEKIDNICNILHLMPDDEVLRVSPELLKFINDKGSRVDYDRLEVILTSLKEWICKHPHTAENCMLDSMNKRTKRMLIVFLVIIGILAIIAVVVALLNFFLGDEFLWGRGKEIADALSTLDFAIGALGFILERIDDMKKKKISNASKIVDETGDADKFIKICGDYIDNSIHQYNRKGDNIIDNSKHYYN